MSERYDIRPNLQGGWDVIDTRNGSGAVSSHPTRQKALQEAIRKDKG